MQVLKLAANAYLLSTPQGPLLVDSGMSGQKQTLLKLLGNTRLAGLVLTHHHLDHAGGAAVLYQRFGMPIFAHPADIPYLTKERRRPRFPPIPLLGDWIANNVDAVPTAALRAVEEGQEVMGWQVVHLPGHTPGQIGLLKDGTLIAADALRSWGGRIEVPPSIVNADTAQAKQSALKIARLPFEVALVGHGPPEGFSREQVLQALQRLE